MDPLCLIDAWGRTASARNRREGIRTATLVVTVALVLLAQPVIGSSQAEAAPPQRAGTLSYSTFFQDAQAIAIDSAGYAYVTGRVDSGAFPTTPGAFDRTFNGVLDTYVAKLTPDGSRLVYSTYLGGADAQDEPSGIAVGPRGEVYLGGSTASADFPTTAGAYDTSHGGVHDAYLVKLSRDGSRLEYSTFLGGDSPDFATSIAIDSRGAAHVAGYTESGDFPTTPGAYDPVIGGSIEAFVAKLSPDGSELDFSTALGGGSEDFGTGIALDPRGSVYVSGSTASDDFPTTAGAADTTFGGFFDAFVTKLRAEGSSLEYSTYLGGADGDIGNGIAVDPRGEAFVAGGTGSPGLATAGAFDPSFGGGSLDAFVAKLDRTGSSLGYLTYLGGGFEDQARGITVDPSGRAHLTGYTQSPGFPITTGAFDSTLAFIDTFVTSVAREGSTLHYSTYLGGTAAEFGQAITAAPSGQVYAVGATQSADFPTTAGAFDTTFDDGVFDSFVTKLDVRP